jgi:[ribosomal protein S5]-alanine N-acetyltransferase
VSRVDTERALETPRLILEPLVSAHAAKLFEPLQDARIYVYESLTPPESAKMLEARYALLAARRSPDGSQIWLNWAVRRKTGEYVGTVQATIEAPRAMIGYDFFPPFWKRGFAREACAEVVRVLTTEFGIQKIEAVVDVENAASIKLLEALGFSRVWTGPSDDMPGHTDHRYERLRSRL